MVTIWISLVISDSEHFLLYLLAIWMAFIEKCLFRSFMQFWLSYCFMLLSCLSSRYILNISPLLDGGVYKYFLPIHKLFIHSINCFFAVKSLFSFMKSHLFLFFFCLSFSDHIKIIIAQTNVIGHSPYFSFWWFYNFRSYI